MQLQFFQGLLFFNPEETEDQIAFQISIRNFIRSGVLFYLEADDLLLGFFLPVRIVAQNFLLESRYVVVEERCEVKDLFEERNWDPPAVVVQNDKGFWLVDGVEVEISELFDYWLSLVSVHLNQSYKGNQPQYLIRPY